MLHLQLSKGNSSLCIRLQWWFSPKMSIQSGKQETPFMNCHFPSALRTTRSWRMPWTSLLGLYQAPSPCQSQCWLLSTKINPGLFTGRSVPEYESLRLHGLVPWLWASHTIIVAWMHTHIMNTPYESTTHWKGRIVEEQTTEGHQTLTNLTAPSEDALYQKGIPKCFLQAHWARSTKTGGCHLITMFQDNSHSKDNCVRSKLSSVIPCIGPLLHLHPSSPHSTTS